MLAKNFNYISITIINCQLPLQLAHIYFLPQNKKNTRNLNMELYLHQYIFTWSQTFIYKTLFTYIYIILDKFLSHNITWLNMTEWNRCISSCRRVHCTEGTSVPQTWHRRGDICLAWRLFPQWKRVAPQEQKKLVWPESGGLTWPAGEMRSGSASSRWVGRSLLVLQDQPSTWLLESVLGRGWQQVWMKP